MTAPAVPAGFLVVCAKVDCDHDSECGLIRDGDHAPTWCLCHVTDDWLPPVVGGVLSKCVACTQSCVSWVVRWPEQPDLCLHERCRRRWFAGQEMDVPEAPVKAVGAYARRRRS